MVNIIRRIQRTRLPRLGSRQIWVLLAISLALIVVLILVPLVPKEVTLNFVVTERDSEQWKPLIEEFQSQNPNIRINLANRRLINSQKPENTDRLREIYTSAKKGEYDLIYLDIIWVPEFVEAELLMDLSDRISDQELNEFLPSGVNGGRYKNKLYRIPLRNPVGVLYYRKDLLESPPETLKDLIEIAQKVQKQEGIDWGYLWQGSQTEAITAMFVEVLHGYGGFWIDPENRDVGLDRPEALQAVEFLRDTIDQKISPMTNYDEEQTRRWFRDGKAVFLRNWPDAWFDVNVPGSPAYGKIAIAPMVHAPGRRSYACEGSWGLGIAKATKHSEEAWKAIQFFMSVAAQRQAVLVSGATPSRRTLFIDPKVVDKYSHYPKLLEIIEENSVLRPAIPQYSQASDILQQYLSNVMEGKQNPQKAMKEAAAETRKLLANGNS